MENRLIKQVHFRLTPALYRRAERVARHQSRVTGEPVTVHRLAREWTIAQLTRALAEIDGEAA